MKKSYHNTNILNADDLKLAEAKARSQETLVYSFFRKNWQRGYSPSKVHQQLIRQEKIKPSVPLTSIRRAISNLTFRKKLRKTGEMVPGAYGMPEHKWKIKIQLKKQSAYKQGKLALK